MNEEKKEKISNKSYVILFEALEGLNLFKQLKVKNVTFNGFATEFNKLRIYSSTQEDAITFSFSGEGMASAPTVSGGILVPIEFIVTEEHLDVKQGNTNFACDFV